MRNKKIEVAIVRIVVLGEKWKIEGVVEITIILRIRDRKPGL